MLCKIHIRTLVGGILAPRIVKAVAPPSSTSLSYIEEVKSILKNTL